MNLFLQRDSYLASGIFGTIFTNDKTFFLQTLEHAYSSAPDLVSDSLSYEPKIPPGSYICVRGNHQLAPTKINPSPQPFQTFEITGVEGHANLLFHTGNYNSDSSGCILLGSARQGDMITNSRDAFEKFMNLQGDCDDFILTIL